MEDPPSAEIGSKPKSKKAGLLQKVARVGATALTIGALVGSDNPPKYSPDEQPTSRITQRAFEERDVNTDYMQQRLTLAAERSGKELKRMGIDPNRETTTDEIEQIAKEAVPYISEVLGIKEVNVPPIKINTEENGYYKFANYIAIAQGPAWIKKVTVLHELAHAQRWQELKAGNLVLFLNTGDEEFAEIVAWESLAKQALQGDKLANYSLINHILCNLNVARGKGEYPQCFGNSGAKPVIVSMEALNGRENYNGVKINALAEFLRKNVLIIETIR